MAAIGRGFLVTRKQRDSLPRTALRPLKPRTVQRLRRQSLAEALTGPKWPKVPCLFSCGNASWEDDQQLLIHPDRANSDTTRSRRVTSPFIMAGHTFQPLRLSRHSLYFRGGGVNRSVEILPVRSWRALEFVNSPTRLSPRH